MNKQKKNKGIMIGIIVTLGVMVTLIGLTYAYYRTKVIGNTGEEKSISNPTKMLKVEYQDDNPEVITDKLYGPGKKLTKEFRVENTGDDTGNYSIILDNIENTLERTWDIRYILRDKTTDEILIKGTLGSELKKQMVYADIEIAVEKTDEYIFELEYENPDEDQSIDMGKQISFKIDIIEAHENIFEGQTSSNTLLYAIGRDNKLVKSPTTPGKQSSSTKEAELSYTEDDYGTSYYFRGNPENNFIMFNNMCWRIVRVLGNGDIKITLYNKNASCAGNSNGSLLSLMGWSSKTDTSTYVSFEGNSVYNYLIKWYSEQFMSENAMLDNLVINATWCNDKSVAEEKEGIVYYGSYKRLFPNSDANPSLKCNFYEENGVSNRVNSKIALLTADEIIFAGGHFSETYGEKGDESGKYYYLINNADTDKWAWWTMSPSSSSSMVRVSRGGRVFDGKLNLNGGYIRPALVLSSLTVLENEENNGTVNMPYIVKETN